MDSGEVTVEVADAAKILDKEFGKLKAIYETALQNAENLQTDKGSAADDGGVMYAITRDDVKLIQGIGERKSINDLTKDELTILESVAQKYYREMGVKSPFFRRWFGDWRAEDKNPINKTTLNSNAKIPGNYIKNEDTGFNIFAGSLLKSETKTHSKNKSNAWLRMLMVNNAEAILNNAILLDSNISQPNGNKSKSTMMMHKFYNICEYNGNLYLAEIYVEEFLNEGEVSRRAYEAKEIKIKPIASSKSGNTPSPQPVTIGSVKNISDLFNFVKTYDKDFNPKPTSLVLNEDGTPKEVYRGDKEDIRVFDRKKSRASNLYGRGFYFTESKSHAKQYGDAKPYYINIKSPLKPNEHSISEEQIRKFLEAVSENEDYDIWNYGTTDIDEIFENVYGKGDFETLQDINATAIGDLVEAVELFNKVNKTSYDGFILPTEIVVFNPNQIKSVDNGGTFSSWNDDIMYSKSSPDSDTTNSDESPFEILTTEQQKLPSVQLKEEVRKKINAYVEKYGELEKGAAPVRDVVMPKKTSEKTFVRRNTRTIAEAEAITDEKAAALIEEVANDAEWTTYERFGDNQAINAAVTEFERIGYDAALARWRAVYASNKRISKQDIADVHLLIQEAAKRGDKKTFIELVSNSAEIGTMAGQVVQAMFLIKRMGPGAQIKALENNIEKAEEEINKRFGRSDFKFDVPQDLIDKYNDALLKEAREEQKAESEGRKILTGESRFDDIENRKPRSTQNKVLSGFLAWSC